MKKKAIKIEVAFSESHFHQDHKHDEKNPLVFEGADCWNAAQAYLNVLAWHGPKSGYHKTDVIVHFENGEKYESRLDIQHPDGSHPDHKLAKHIIDFCRFYGGLLSPKEIPSHLTQEQYAEIATREHVQWVKAFFAEYEIPQG